ncbi:MAG: TonB-dependent receptor [Nannocystis sp.]|nr:TonB-dependent receptor [Nannocystis sp.]
MWKAQGVPGPATAQSDETALSTLLARTFANLSHASGRFEWVAGLGAERRRYDDPRGELGLGRDDERLLALDAYLSPRINLPLWTGATLNLLSELRAESVDVDERTSAATGATGDARRRRQAVAAGLQLEQRLGDRLLLAGTLRGDAIHSRFAAPAGAGEHDDRGRDELRAGLSPRLAGRLRLWRGLDLRASVGRYFRAPTLIELFGDRGYIIGNEGLRPERGDAVDGGFVVDLTRGYVAVQAHAAGFATRAHDLIQWIQTGPVLQPQNIASARLRGLESGLYLDLWRRALTLEGNYTLLATTNDTPEQSASGKRLPGRPLHELFARAALGRRIATRHGPLEPRIFYSVEHVAGTFLDPSERYGLPPRTLHGLGAELHVADRLHLVAELRNLFDARITRWRPPIAGLRPLPVPITDFIGYPLPGRSLWVSLRVDIDRLSKQPH